MNGPSIRQLLILKCFLILIKMIRYCNKCDHCEHRQILGGVDVKCTNELAPNSWRNKWIHRTETATIKSPLMCPVPDKWFREKVNEPKS